MPDFGVIVYEPGGNGMLSPDFLSAVTVIGPPGDGAEGEVVRRPRGR